MRRDSRWARTALTKMEKNMKCSVFSSSVLPLNSYSSSKSKVWRVFQRLRKWREMRGVVWTVVLVGRKERMWQSKESGRLLNLSTSSFSPPLFSSSAMVVSFLERSFSWNLKRKQRGSFLRFKSMFFVRVQRLCTDGVKHDCTVMQCEWIIMEAWFVRPITIFQLIVSVNLVHTDHACHMSNFVFSIQASNCLDKILMKNIFYFLYRFFFTLLTFHSPSKFTILSFVLYNQNSTLLYFIL